MKNILILVGTALFVLLGMQSCKKEEECVETTFYQDSDGDGKGNSAETLTACEQPEGYVANGDDDDDKLGAKNVQRAILCYNGATWCGPCGSRGEPAKEYIEEHYGDDKVIILNSQSVDPISPQGSFGAHFTGYVAYVMTNGAQAYLPWFYWLAHGYTPSDHGAPEVGDNEIIDATIAEILASEPAIEVGALATLSGSTVNVEVELHFLEDFSSSNYIGVYLMEDGVMAVQAGITSSLPVPHNNVLRAATNYTYQQNWAGTEAIGTATADEEKRLSYSLTVDPSWDSSNLQVAVIVYENSSVTSISNGVLVDVN